MVGRRQPWRGPLFDFDDATGQLSLTQVDALWRLLPPQSASTGGA
jgi:hypothetical protein